MQYMAIDKINSHGGGRGRKMNDSERKIEMKEKYRVKKNRTDLHSIINNISEYFWKNHRSCNVVWCSDKIKKELRIPPSFDVGRKRKIELKTIDIIESDFGIVKIFSTRDVEFKKLKPKYILAFIEE